MPRKERYQEPGHYHIINRGVERRSIYLEPEDYEFFLDLLLKLTKEYEITIHAFCLMTNHYHLLFKKRGVSHHFETFLNFSFLLLFCYNHSKP
ncbi:transposase [Sulfurimonas sp.]|uniref:transposase n=1 Tax=Sulfurimonas sp. TaxID=2022749 RepID=UPI002A35CCDC|nr:transposase [Sulfurimonas sp.]MDY0122925.1 transposase [Sulfurimonas sp.]